MFSFKKKTKEKTKDSDDEGSVEHVDQHPKSRMSGFIYKVRETGGLKQFKKKKEHEIKDLEAKIYKRKWAFGDEYLRLAEQGAPASELQKCVKTAQKEVKEMEKEIEKMKVEIEEKAKEVESKLEAVKEGGGGGATTPPASPKKEPKKKKALRGGGDDFDKSEKSDGNAGLEEDTEQPKEKKKKKKVRKSEAAGSAGAAGMAGMSVPSNRKSKSRPSYIPPAWTNDFIPQTRSDEADPKRWKQEELRFNGKAKYKERGIQQNWSGSIKEAMEKFKKAPEKYVALMYQSDMVEWDEDEQECTVVYREGTINWKPDGITKDGWMTVFVQHYERCKPFPNNEFPMGYRDKYTDNFTFKGTKIHSGNIKPVMPGRGMGVGDAPNLKIIGDIDPSDIFQGSVGDCWLLSGISAVAEFDGAIKKLFRKTKNVMNMPTDEPNVYTITLWDLTTWKEVDIVIDERLCAHPDGEQQLLASKVSEDGELWAAYLEKAIAAHAGGWDKLVGGQCTHAWSLLTGCKEQYTILKYGGSKKYSCCGRFNTPENRWARHGNSPHDGEQGVWPMAWPEVGGGGDGEITKEELFMKMVAWDKENYIVAAGTKGDSDENTTEGMVDNHAYTVITSMHNVAGTGIDMMKVRNPWGKGEIEDGEFDDDGPGWDKYPQIKELLKPVVADDGIFWVTKDEFFDFFETIYVSASDMTSFLEDTNHQYD